MRKPPTPLALKTPPIPQHPALQRVETLLGKQATFKHPKTGELLKGTIVGSDYRPVTGGQDGVFLVVHLPPKKDPYAPGEVLKPLLSSCAVTKS